MAGTGLATGVNGWIHWGSPNYYFVAFVQENMGQCYLKISEEIKFNLYYVFFLLLYLSFRPGTLARAPMSRCLDWAPTLSGLKWIFFLATENGWATFSSGGGEPLLWYDSPPPSTQADYPPPPTQKKKSCGGGLQEVFRGTVRPKWAGHKPPPNSAPNPLDYRGTILSA